MTVYYTVTADIIFNTRGISVSESDHTDVIDHEYNYVREFGMWAVSQRRKQLCVNAKLASDQVNYKEPSTTTLDTINCCGHCCPVPLTPSLLPPA